MDELEQRFKEVIQYINDKYGLLLQGKVDKSYTRYGVKYTSSMMVMDTEATKPVYLILANTGYGEYWTEEQIEKQVITCLCLNNKIYRRNKMPQVYENSIDNNDRAEKEGASVAEAILPFLRTDVPADAPFALALVLSNWHGFPNNALFMRGFVRVFSQYQSANKQIEG